MRAVTLTAQGAPDVLHLDSLPDPTPGAGEIRVETTAAAVNPVDLKTRSGFLADIALIYPAVLGWDVAGTVVDVGPDTDRFAVGDPVIGMVAQPAHRYGTYAELVVAPAQLFAPAPADTPLADAAALPLAGLTARQALLALQVAPGDAVLVTGAGGAVGRFAVELLLANGHEVGALVRPADVPELSALAGVRTYVATAEVPAASYAAVLDTAGVASAVDAVRDAGRFVSIADTDQPGPQRGIEPAKSYVNEDGDALAELADLVEKQVLRLRIGARYGLHQAERAHAEFEAGGRRGKFLLLPSIMG